MSIKQGDAQRPLCHVYFRTSCPDIGLRYESLDGKHTSAGCCQKDVGGGRSICRESKKQAKPIYYMTLPEAQSLYCPMPDDSER